MNSNRVKSTPITYILLLVNLIVFFNLDYHGSTESAGYMLEHGAMNPYMVYVMGEWYRLVTSIFMHFGFRHLFNNMIMLVSVGQIAERAVGSFRFSIIYILSGVVASFGSFFFRVLMNSNDVVAGASGAIFGIIGCLLIVVIVHRGKYAGITLRRMIIMAALTLYFGFATAGTDNIGHVCGFVFGMLFTFLVYGIPTILKRRKINDSIYTPEYR